MPKSKKRGVRKEYTYQNLKDDLLAVYVKNNRRASLRALAKKYGVTHAAVKRVIDGHEPMDRTIRAKFGLSEIIPVPVCPKCGKLHSQLKQCQPRKCKPTFEENALAYDQWKRANADKLGARVAWAEGKTK